MKKGYHIVIALLFCIIFASAGCSSKKATGTPNAAFDQGESIVPILNTVGFDAMVLENNDYFLGVDQISDLTDGLNYQVMAGNVVTTAGEYLWEPSTVITLRTEQKL